MKKPYRRIVLFFLILVAILFLMDLWMDKEIYPHWPLQYEEAFYPKVNADVILMGASHTTHGVNPKFLEKDGLKVFNFAYNGASPVFSLKWYRKVFEPNYRRPTCVIYGVHWIMFDDQYLKRQLEQDSKYFPFRFFLSEFRDVKTLKTLILNRFAFIRERKQILPRIFRKKRDREVYPVSRYYHGYIPFETKRDLDEKEKVNPKINPEQLKAFEELLDEFQRENIRVIFVMIPDYIPGRDSSTIQTSINLIRKMAEERKIPLLDYENDRVSEINYNRDYYVDWAHLNGKGSDAFSKLLRRDFEAEGLFKLCSDGRDG
jgi:hypothetical protein